MSDCSSCSDSDPSVASPVPCCTYLLGDTLRKPRARIHSTEALVSLDIGGGGPGGETGAAIGTAHGGAAGPSHPIGGLETCSLRARRGADKIPGFRMTARLLVRLAPLLALASSALAGEQRIRLTLDESLALLRRQNPEVLAGGLRGRAGGGGPRPAPAPPHPPRSRGAGGTPPP